MTLRGVICTGALTLMAQQMVPAWVGGHIPTQTAYTLSEACRWHPKPWALSLGPSVRPWVHGPALTAEARCWASHGGLSPIPFLKVIEPTFPSRDQLARWESEDATPLRPAPND